MMEKLGKRLVKRKPDPKLLTKLKWTPVELQQFVERYRKVKVKGEKKGGGGAVHADSPRAKPPPLMPRPVATTQRGTGVDQKVTIRSRTHKAEEKGESLFEMPEDTVSPEYRRLVEEYRKALSE